MGAFQRRSKGAQKVKLAMGAGKGGGVSGTNSAGATSLTPNRTTLLARLGLAFGFGFGRAAS